MSDSGKRSALAMCWCPGCGVVRVEWEPLPFCRHNIEATAPHPARRMEPLPAWHPFAKDES